MRIQTLASHTCRNTARILTFCLGNAPAPTPSYTSHPSRGLTSHLGCQVSRHRRYSETLGANKTTSKPGTRPQSEWGYLGWPACPGAEEQNPGLGGHYIAHHSRTPLLSQHTRTHARTPSQEEDALAHKLPGTSALGRLPSPAALSWTLQALWPPPGSQASTFLSSLDTIITQVAFTVLEAPKSSPNTCLAPDSDDWRWGAKSTPGFRRD